jgi:peptidoglycan hydrolase-like protein with peptidoglycan-binding domain
MRRTLMLWMIMALAILPLMAGAQPAGETPEGRSSGGHLFPKDAHPGQPTLEVVPEQTSVRDAQIALQNAGFDPGRIDGVMGAKTQEALREFQASQGLPQTGTLDAATQRQLRAEHTPDPSGRQGIAPRR